MSETTKSTGLHQRALLVSYRRVGVWQGNEADDQVVKDAAEKYHINASSTKDAGRAEMNLFPGCRKPIDDVINAIERGYKRFKEMTYNWWPSAQILPTVQFEPFTKEMRPYLADVDRLREELYKAYPDMVQTALKNRGAKANPRDYVDHEKIPQLYQVKIVYSKVPEAGDIRVELPAEMIEEIKLGLKDEVERNTANLVQESLRRMSKALLAAQKNLSGAKIRPEWFNNLQSLLGLVEAFNVNDDDFLKRLVAKSQDVLEHTPDVLRHNPELQRQKAQEVDDLLGEILRAGNGEKS